MTRPIAVVLAALVVACAGFAAGLWTASERTVLSRGLAGQKVVASVREYRPCAWRACRSLWVSGPGGDARQVETLTEGERVDEIAWAPDGGRVGFVVNGYQLRVFDAATGAAIGAVNLIDPDGSPSSRIVRGVTFSNNGAAVTFDDCPREHSGCRPGLVSLERSR